MLNFNEVEEDEAKVVRIILSQTGKTNRNLRMKRIIVFKWVAMLSIILLLVACGKPETQTVAPPDEEDQIVQPVTPGEGDSDQVVENEEPEEPEYPFYAPLTGMGSETEITARPVMVMIENSPQARPQTGLDQADIVYEILAEGEITRFAAIYQSQSPEVIGPVRSIRPYYVEIGEAYDALIVHAGWSQAAINMINSKRLAHFDQVYGDDAYYWRATDRKAPHNLYTSIELIRSGAVKKKYREQWNANAYSYINIKELSLERDAMKITIPYIRGYQVVYEFDESSGTYLRNMAGEAHIDPVSEKQLAAANVLVVVSKHRVLDDEGRRSVDMSGPGQGYLFQNGTAQEITWKKSNGIIRAFVDDKEVPLVRGQTWIQFVQEGTNVTIEKAL